MQPPHPERVPQWRSICATPSGWMFLFRCYPGWRSLAAASPLTLGYVVWTPLGSDAPDPRPLLGLCIGQRISVAFGGSESRQDFRYRGTAETLGEFRYHSNSLAVPFLKLPALPVARDSVAAGRRLGYHRNGDCHASFSSLMSASITCCLSPAVFPAAIVRRAVSLTSPIRAQGISANAASNC